jgi:hypothetical protein
MRIFQAERGLYENWNRCIREARGRYVYMAPSDDTMVPRCLEHMASALDVFPECGLCHCCLTVIDEEDRVIEGVWEDLPAQRFYGELLSKRHLRRAPLDGVLHLGLNTVYTSFTQLLVRRDVFDRIGLFRSDWGPAGDFEWGMRASLACDTLHLPEYLATWRLHRDQATPAEHEPGEGRRLIDMARAALAATGHRPLPPGFPTERALDIYHRRELQVAYHLARGARAKWKTVLPYVRRRPGRMAAQLGPWLLGKLGLRPFDFVNAVETMKHIVQESGLSRGVQVV